MPERKKVKGALWEIEEKFRAFATAAADAIIHIDDLGRIAYWNPAAERMFGYPASEAMGKGVHTLLAPEEMLGEYKRGFAVFSRTGNGPAVGRTTEFVAVRKDGTQFPIEVSVSAIRIKDTWQAVGIIRDISERKRAERAVKESNELIEKIFSGIEIPIAYLDRDFNFIRVNHAYARADGRPPDFFAGSNHFDLYPHAENEAIFRRAVETAEPFSVFEKPFVYPEHPERGVTYWDWSLVPVKDDDGGVAGLILSLLDVTDRKRAEDALWDSEKKFRGIFNATFQFMALLSTEGKVIEINQAALDFGDLKYSDVIEKPFWDAYWWSASEVSREGLRHSVADAAGGRFVRYEVQVLGSGGKTATVDFSLKPVFDESRRAIYLIAEGRDITERKRMEELIARHASRAGALDEISQAFAETGLDRQAILDIIARYASELIGDDCVIRLLSDDGTQFGPIAVHHPDPEKSAFLRETLLSAPHGIDEGLYGQVFSTGKPLLLPVVSKEQMRLAMKPEFRPLLDRMDFHSLLIVPLRAEGRVIGTLSVSRTSAGRSYTIEDQIFLQDIAGRASLAISNADLYERAQKELAERKRLEELMREREFMAAVLDTIASIVVVLDRKGRIVSLNRAGQSVAGYSEDEVKGRPIWDVFLLPEEADYFKAALFGPRDFPNQRENHWRTREGRLRLILWSNTSIVDEDGNLAYVIGTGMDVTERKLAEREREAMLAEITRQSCILQTVLDNAYSNIALFNGANLALKWANSAFYRWLGKDCSMADLTGRSFEEFMPEAYRAGLEKILMQVAETLEPFHASEHEFDDPSRGKTYWKLTLVPLFLEKEDCPAILVRALDMTEEVAARKRVEELAGEVMRHRDGLEELVGERTAELAERVKEMECLYAVSGALNRDELSLDEILQEVVNLIPPALRCPGIASARVNFAGAEMKTPNFLESPFRVSSDIYVGGRRIGVLEMFYGCEPSGPAAPSFLKEERELLKAIAQRIGETIEKRKAEEVLREREERFRKIFEEGPLGMAFVGFDNSFVRVNRTLCEMVGFTAEELTSMKFTDITHPDDLEANVANIRKLLGGEIPFYKREKRYVKKDSSILWINITVSVIRDEYGNPLYFLTMVEDINERKKADRELSRLAAAVASTAEAVVITDSRGVIQYANPAAEKITGYGAEEARGKLLDIMGLDGAGAPGLWDTLKAGSAWSGLVNSRKKDGTPYQEEVTISPILDHSGAIMNYVAIRRDVTEKLRLESIAEAVNSMNSVGYIFSGIRHEIGNPVNSIKMTLSVLRNRLEESSPETVREYVERSLNEVSRLEYLLKALKSFNMYETPEIKCLHVNNFMKIFVSLVSGDSAKKGIRLETFIDRDAEYVQADPRALQQVLLNIMANAFDALEGMDRPRVSIVVSRVSGLVRIRVEDNGCGMTDRQLADLFKPFHTTKAHGTGLGLMITKKMITKMNGSLEIAGRRGRGTSVDIYLPEGTVANC